MSTALDPTGLDPSTATVDDGHGGGDHGVLAARRGIIRRTFSTKRAWIGAGVIALVTLWAFIGPALSPYRFTDIDPLAFGAAPSAAHWFGTNDIGQDIYTQTLVGLQKSLIIGFLAGPAASIIAGIVGSISGYFGGITDRVALWIIDLLLVIPAFYIIVLVSPLLRELNYLALVLGLALFSWMVMARVVRGQTMSLRERDYVKAARYMGVPGLTIVRRHIIPNVASLLIIDATLAVGAAILFESTISFFGFGVQPPDVSLGTLLALGSAAAVTRPWLFVFPAAVLVITVLATSLLGDALRDAVDPTSGAARA